MGQRMKEEPIVYGDDCLACFAVGKTPKYVNVRFSGIIPCPDDPPKICGTPPNDRVFKLTQDPLIPCYYHLVTGGWILDFAHLDPVSGDCILSIIDPNGRDVFYGYTPACYGEGHVFHNSFTDCIGWNCGYGGIGIVTWTPQASDILAAMNISKANDLFMEIFPRPDGKLVYKFCRLQDATNIKILYEL